MTSHRSLCYRKPLLVAFFFIWASGNAPANSVVATSSGRQGFVHPDAGSIVLLHKWQLADRSLGTLNANMDSDNEEKDEAYGRIYSDETDVSACIQVQTTNGKVKKGTKLILGDCSSDDKNDKWRLDSHGLIHSQYNDEGQYCMQAGHGGPVKSGEFLRLYECHDKKPLQHFVYHNGGGIRPKSNPDLCVVWQGVHANIGKDFIILKECEEVPDRNDWSPSGDSFVAGGETDVDHHDDSMDEKNDNSIDDEDDDSSPCVDAAIPEFIIHGNTDIGDPSPDEGPGSAVKCGPNCYTVQDNNGDYYPPPFDPFMGDKLHFAYKVVASNDFSIQARVCGVDCVGGYSNGEVLFPGRAGLMIRESLDPFATNAFVSHQPNWQADWSYRTVAGGETMYGMDGSPDVTCLWIYLERKNGNMFTSAYAYDDGSNSPCGRQSFEEMEWLNLTLSIEMPEQVFVGLAVSSTGVSPPVCQSTKVDFESVECRGCH